MKFFEKKEFQYMFSLSLIIPIHNEAKILQNNLKLLYQYLINISGSRIKNFEIIIVDNGSLDKSQEIIKSLLFFYPKIRSIFIKQKTLGLAIKKGIQEAKYEYLFIYDIDLPFGLEIISRSLEEMKKNDFIIGSKRHPCSKIKIFFLRRFYSNLCNRLIRTLFNLKVFDTQGSLFLKKSIVKKYLHLINSKGAWFKTQLILYGKLFGARIKEIPVNYIAKRHSKMKAMDALMFLIDLWKEYFQYKKIFSKLRLETKFRKNNLNRMILLLIIIVTVLSYILFLGNWPMDLNQDEVSKGYQAYSILKTGYDYRGNYLPLYFTDFSDKLPNTAIFLTYAMIPLIAIFGLNEFVLRLPVAIFGILSILMIYFLTKELFKKESIALLSSFLLAISPYHILYSRIAIEPITLPCFLIIGFYFLYRGIKRNPKMIYLSMPFLALSLYSYQPALLFVPLFLFIFYFIFRNRFIKFQKETILALLIFTILISPLIYLYLTKTKEMTGYFNQMSVFSWGLGSFSLLLFLLNLAFYFHPYFLINLFSLPLTLLFFCGLVFLFKKINNKRNKLLFFTMIISLIPASLTLPSFQTSRSITVIPLIVILAAYGLFKIYHFLSIKYKLSAKKIIFTLSLILIILSLLNFDYYLKIKFPHNLNQILNLQYGLKDVIRYISKVQDKYEKIVFTNKANQPFIFFLFYLKYNPAKFQTIKVEREYLPNGYQVVKSFDKYIFCDINQCYNPKENNLYVARAHEIPDVKEKKIFYNLDGSVFRIITND